MRTASQNIAGKGIAVASRNSAVGAVLVSNHDLTDYTQQPAMHGEHGS